MVKAARIMKPSNSSSQNHPGGHDTILPANPPSDHVDPSREVSSLLLSDTSFNGAAPSVSEPVSQNGKDSSPETLSSFDIANVMNAPIPRETDTVFRPLFENAERIVRIGIHAGWNPSICIPCSCSSKHHPPAHHLNRTEAAERKAILDQACKNRPLGSGKPLPLNRLLAGYGRQEYPLGDQMAVSHKLDDSTRCEQCRALQMQCVFVDEDRFWNRGQCVLCVQRKTPCSLDEFNMKKRILRE